MSTDRAPSPLWEVAVDDVPVSVSARGDLVAVATAGGTVSVLAAATGDTLDSLSVPGGAERVELSPDARDLVATGPRGHTLWNRMSGRSQPTAGAAGAGAAWSADGEQVAVAAGHHAVVLDALGREAWRTDGRDSPVTGVAWLPQGHLAVAADGRVHTHESQTGHPVGSYACAGRELALAVSPTGKWMCAGSADAEVHVWRTPGGKGLSVRGYPERVSRLSFDETGYWLATDGSPDVTVWDFSRGGLTDRAPRRLRHHRTVTALAWRPGTDGHLATGGRDGAVALWYATSGRAHSYLSPARLLGPEGGDGVDGGDGPSAVTALAWAGPRRLITARGHGRVRAHEMPTRAAL
ncbi:WD40 repeat domain-containing protein [Streptomyces triticagri]|uniref:WD40 repeat domain-containing protein n=1 Tax=Streptomyces triticagri TaxID=2293568 RepID=A0A372MAJ9_9ACTN|nr:WD40 repeat domain-containing protein [Streptomyces triticagri]